MRNQHSDNDDPQIDDDDNFISNRNDENKVSREPEREPSKSTHQQTFEEQKLLSSRNQARLNEELINEGFAENQYNIDDINNGCES